MKLHLSLLLMFMLILALFRLLKVADSPDDLLLWVIAIIVFFMVSIVSVWKRFSLKSAVSVLCVYLTLSVVYLKFTSLHGYTTDQSFSSSNFPTIKQGDLVVSRWFDLDLNRGDMVAVVKGGTIHRKRLHGLPHDNIEICNDLVFVNGLNYAVSNDWIGRRKRSDERCSSRSSFIILQENEYFAVGDNLKDSYDSRHYGVLFADEIVAKSLYIFSSEKGNFFYLAKKFYEKK